jgi:tRNA threonylcarbamoyladenosine biosynthesis protein TsaB
MVPPVNVLAIETATPACAVGVATTDGLEVTRVLDDGQRHTEALALTMSELLGEVHLEAHDIGRVMVDRGPGLYTGLRVGISTALAFAQGLGCDLVAATSLELLAMGALDAGVRGTVVSCVDARRGEIFVQAFTLDTELSEAQAPTVRTARDVVIEWATNGAPVTFTGDGVDRYLADFAAVPNAQLFTQRVPSLHAALQFARRLEPLDVVTPLYLREADAVANFSTRTRPARA